MESLRTLELGVMSITDVDSLRERFCCHEVLNMSPLARWLIFHQRRAESQKIFHLVLKTLRNLGLVATCGGVGDAFVAG